MPIEFQPELGRLQTAVKIEPSLGFGNDKMLVWWYSGFYKNKSADSQPLVWVSFRQYISPGIVGDKVVNKRVPLTSLGQLRVGTVWQHDRCQSEAIFKPREFEVDFRDHGWRFTSFMDARTRRASPPFPPELHKLALETDSSWLIEFDLKNGGKLLVPCIEFFTRCYGSSGELKRVLATYSWEEAYARLYAPLGEEREDGKWQVRLRRRMFNGDVVFLAHVLYDNRTGLAAKKIHSQLEARFDPKGTKPAFIQVWPWFHEPAALKVNGLYFDNGKSFLALSIVGMSEPTGDPIYRGRENSGTAERAAPDGSPKAWQGVLERTVRNLPIIDLTGDVEPDTDTPAVEIQDPYFEILGNEREVIDIRSDHSATTAGLKKIGADASLYSAGEPQGSGKKVGRAVIHAPRRLESQGMLRDMWEAMQSLHRKHPSLIRSVHSYTFEQSFSSATTPNLILLQPFASDARVTTTVRRFPYIDPPSPDLRGILVARLVIADGPVYIVEIERRIRKPKTGREADRDSEDAFQGMVFRLHDERTLLTWLTYFAEIIRVKNGVVKHVIAACPGTAFAFSHLPVEVASTICPLEEAPSNVCMPREATVLHALEKITGRRWLLGVAPCADSAIGKNTGPETSPL